MSVSVFQSVSGKVYGGYGFIALITAVAAAVTVYTTLAVETHMIKLKQSANDAALTSQVDIDMTTFNLVFRRFMLTENDQSEWERAQRIYGGLEAGLGAAAEGVSSEERRQAVAQIATNAAIIRDAAAEIARTIDARQRLATGPLGAALDELDVTLAWQFANVNEATTPEQLRTLLAISDSWRKARYATERALRLPDASLAQEATDAFASLTDQSSSLSSASQVQETMAAATSALNEYVAMSAAEAELVATALNSLAFETGGIAETTRLAAGEDQVVAAAAAEKSLQDLTQITSIALALTVIFAILLAFIVARSVAAPIGRIKIAMLGVANGDTGIVIPETDRRDEIGEMAKATEVFRDNVQRTAAIERENAEADARRREEARSKQLELIDTVEGSMGQVITSLLGSAGNTERVSERLSTDATSANELSVSMAAAAEEASASVATVAAAVEEFSATLSSMTASVQDVAARTNSATEEASDAQLTLDRLQESMQGIVDVVASINDVAEQTNLLALNATIEAARAGEAGKGFAVVAAEVKALADQTRRMTDEISKQVNTVDGNARDAIQRTRQIVEQVSSIDGAVDSIRDTMQQQDAVTTEISRAAQDASSGSISVSSDVQLVQRAAQSMYEASMTNCESVKAIVQNAAEVQEQMDTVVKSVRNG